MRGQLRRKAAVGVGTEAPVAPTADDAATQLSAAARGRRLPANGGAVAAMPARTHVEPCVLSRSGPRQRPPGGPSRQPPGPVLRGTELPSTGWAQAEQQLMALRGRLLGRPAPRRVRRAARSTATFHVEQLGSPQSSRRRATGQPRDAGAASTGAFHVERPRSADCSRHGPDPGLAQIRQPDVRSRLSSTFAPRRPRMPNTSWTGAWPGLILRVRCRFGSAATRQHLESDAT